MSATSGVSTSEGFSPEQLDFLNDNVVVYDFHKKVAHQDFSEVATCQVALVGETHLTSVCDRIQRGLFEKGIFGNQPTCVLEEGLKRGETLSAEQIKEVRDYLPPSAEVRGSDVRWGDESTEYVGDKKWEKKSVHYRLEVTRQEAIYFDETVKVLNDYFNSGSNLGVESNEQLFLLSDEAIDRIKVLVENRRLKKRLMIQERPKCPVQKNDHEFDDAEILRSNDGLFQEIEKAHEQFPKVLAIWGSAHFVTDERFMKALDQARISYVILLPNQQREAEAKNESNWLRKTTRKCELKIGNKEQPFVVKLPESMRYKLCPELQAICLRKTDDPLVLDASKLEELFKEKNSYEFPSGKEVHFENIPLSDYHHFTDLGEVKHELANGQGALKLTQVLRILNNILMIKGLGVNSLHLAGDLRWGVGVSSNHKPFLEVSSDNAWSITVEPNSRYGYASYLFQEMKRLSMHEYSLGPGEELLFYISEEEFEQIVESPQKIAEYLDSKLPSNSQLDFEGDLVFILSDIKPFEGAPMQPALVLYSKTGLKIKLT